MSFERRPSVWVEPKDDWGKGSVGLFELPTEAEIFDNINAFWVPATQATADQTWQFDYRLYWTDHAPLNSTLAKIVATRTGRAGRPGTYRKQTPVARKFVIDFAGDTIADRKPDSGLVIDVTTSSGEIVNPYVIPIGTDTHRWRAFFDWTGDVPAEQAAVVLRAVLRDAEQKTLSETWVYSYHPRTLPT